MSSSVEDTNMVQDIQFADLTERFSDSMVSSMLLLLVPIFNDLCPQNISYLQFF